MFEVEPAKDNPLFGAPNLICTPHLGAATGEAQENVALQVAEQMADYLLKGAISNAVNFPSITAEEAPRLTPYIKLAEQLGLFAGQLTETRIKGIKHRLFGRGRRTQRQADDGGRRRDRAEADAGRQHQHGLGRDGREGARHQDRGDQARPGRHLRKLHQADRR